MSEHPLRAEVLKLFEERTNATVGEILGLWLERPDSKVEVCPSLNDETDTHEGVALGFGRGGGEPFFVSIPLTVVSSQYPTIRPASEFITAVGGGGDQIPSLETDSQKVDQMLGIARDDLYDDVVCGEMLTFTDAIKFIVMYGLCPWISITITELDSEVFEEYDTEEWVHHGKRVLWVSVLYHDRSLATKDYIPGFAEWVYTTIERPRGVGRM